jgi:hypothetical protein
MSFASTADFSPTAGLVGRSADLVGDSFLHAGAADRREGRHPVEESGDVGTGMRRLIFEKQDRAFAVSCVAIVIAVNEECPDFTQVARSNRLIAHHARGSRAGRPAIDHDETHVVLPVIPHIVLVTVSLGRFGRDRGHFVSCNLPEY